LFWNDFVVAAFGDDCGGADAKSPPDAQATLRGEK
jgi:hypothetical protein